MEHILKQVAVQGASDNVLAVHKYHIRRFRFELYDKAWADRVEDDSPENIEAEVSWHEEIGEGEAEKRTYRETDIVFDPGLGDSEPKQQMLDIIMRAMKEEGVELLGSKKYEGKVAWTMVGTVQVDANDEDEARDLILDAPLPEGEFMGDSFEIIEVQEVKPA